MAEGTADDVITCFALGRRSVVEPGRVGKLAVEVFQDFEHRLTAVIAGEAPTAAGLLDSAGRPFILPDAVAIELQPAEPEGRRPRTPIGDVVPAFEFAP